VEDQQAQSVWVLRREPSRDAVALPRKDHGVLNSRHFDDCCEVVRPLVQDRTLPIDDWIRQPETPAVEHHHTTEGPEPFKQSHEPRIVLKDLHRDETPGDHDDINGRVALHLRIEDPIRDMSAIRSARIRHIARYCSLA
jgi:hypothetical protein